MPSTISTASTYRPPWWYRGRHLQTLWGPLLRRGRRPAVRRERVETLDGDFIDLDWLPARERGVPLVLILHGLEGSARSHYALGLLRDLEQLGWRGLVLHFRSCGGEIIARSACTTRAIPRTSSTSSPGSRRASPS